jgi:hypothetical protein
MNDDIFTGRLSDYLDQELTDAERVAVEAHLAACAACRMTLSELRAVTERARRLEDTAPAADLWPGVAERLEARVAAAGADRIRPFRSAIRRRFTFTLPQLAAAGIALMVLSGGMVWMAQSGHRDADFPVVSADAVDRPDDMRASPVNVLDTNYDQAVSDLEQLLERGRGHLDPETIRVLEDNLRAIDQSIDQSRRALAGDPANTYLNGHLARAKQRKLALLRRASGFATAGS